MFGMICRIIAIRERKFHDCNAHQFIFSGANVHYCSFLFSLSLRLLKCTKVLEKDKKMELFREKFCKKVAVASV